MATAYTEVRAAFNPDDWQSWGLPSDKSNPAQLKRIVAEWAEQKEILSALLSVDPNPSRALGMLLQSHALLQNAQVVVSASAPGGADNGFTDNSDDF